MDAIKDAASKVSDAVSGAGRGSVDSALLVAAQNDIKKQTGSDITVTIGDVPDEWSTWMTRTGINSIANEDTWAFLVPTQYNETTLALWKERAIDTIVLLVNARPAEEDKWIVCDAQWETGSKTLKVCFNMPTAGEWASDATWVEPGDKRWWNISDEIIFALQLYQLPGKCFYKSDWLDGFEDVDESSIIPNATTKVRRWFQFRHWIIYWYPAAQWGWNWPFTDTPPKLPDGSLFDLKFVMSCPSMPHLSMPDIQLPTLPNVHLPSLPSMPSLSVPSLSAPSLSMPSLGELPSLPDRLHRPAGKWACHGFIQLDGMRVKTDGKKLILSNAKLTNFWEKAEGQIDTQEKDHQRLVLEATTAEQAESWKQSLIESGVQEGDIGGCCTVA